MSEGYKGKHIWIIGAGSGIGRALAGELSRRGATLALSSRGTAALESLRHELGDRHVVCPLDVTDLDAVIRAAAAIAAGFPSLDSVIFMAGAYRPMAPDKMDMAVAHGIIDTNFKGALNTVHAVLPVFARQRTGQIALCGSVAGYRGLPNSQPYSATKAAVINFAESLRADRSLSYIDVKLICPGFVRTPMTDKNSFAMPMMIEPEEAARAIANGLQSRSFEIHFPKRMTLIMKLLKIMPSPLYFRLAAIIKN